MRRVLVVEDDVQVSMLLRTWLTELGHEVIGPVHKLEDALDLAALGDLDAVFLDFSLGGKNAEAVVDLLRSRRVPFALVTGYGTDGLPPTYKGMLVLAKPFDFTSVERTAKELLSGAGPPPTNGEE
jgi:DNA-binding response OmpR family regulator